MDIIAGTNDIVTERNKKIAQPHFKWSCAKFFIPLGFSE